MTFAADRDDLGIEIEELEEAIRQKRALQKKLQEEEEKFVLFGTEYKYSEGIVYHDRSLFPNLPGNADLTIFRGITKDDELKYEFNLQISPPGALSLKYVSCADSLQRGAEILEKHVKKNYNALAQVVGSTPDIAF